MEQSALELWVWKSIALTTGEAFTQKPSHKEMKHQITEGQGPRPHTGSSQLRVYRFLSHPHLQWGPRGGFQRQVFLSAVICLELNLLSFSHGNCFWNLSIALVPGQRWPVVAPSIAETSLPAKLGCLSSRSAYTSTGHWVQRGAAFLQGPQEQQEQGTEELVP